MRSVILWAAVIGLGIQVSTMSEAATPKPKPHLSPKFVVSDNPWPYHGAWTPANLCKSYNFPTNLPGGGVIGIVELGGAWNQADLDAFSKLNNMPKISVTNVSVDGGKPVSSPGGADYEVMLDIELSAFTYYYATGKMPKIVVFFAPNTFQGFIDCVPAAVKAGCDVLSISWGAPEPSWESGQAKSLEAFETQAAAATAKGLTIFAASGDNSSSDGYYYYYYSDPNVDGPASCPHVIGCGGTTKEPSGEIVWGDGNAFDYGTGGGYSAIFPVQSWQVGAPPPPKGLGRMVPDIAADANPVTGIVIVADGSQVQIGGTSMVAPFYSGLFAAFGTKLGLKGSVTQKLWANQYAFSDITFGFNGDYNALKGPDPCSGIGVPNATYVADLFGYTGNLNYVSVTQDTKANIITLNDDAASNSVSMSWSKGAITIVGNGNTVLGSKSSYQKSMTFKWPNSNVQIVGSFTNGGNNWLGIVGFPITVGTLVFGEGNDTAVLDYDVVSKLTFVGGAGTNSLQLVGTTVGSINSNVQAVVVK